MLRRLFLLNERRATLRPRKATVVILSKLPGSLPVKQRLVPALPAQVTIANQLQFKKFAIEPLISPSGGSISITTRLKNVGSQPMSNVMVRVSTP